MDLPRADPSTARAVATPQLPDEEEEEELEADLPRQSQAQNQRQMPSSAAGGDRSGG